MKHFRILTYIVAAAICCGGCNRYAQQQSSKPTVTVSIEPQRWLLEQIVGDDITINTLLANGGNPESYEPTFANLAELENSACYMTVGHLPFETALVDRIKSNNPNLTIVNTADSIELIVDNTHDHGIDPHIWSSAQNARIIARTMLNAVEQIDTANAATYRCNYTKLIAAIDSIDSVCAAILASESGKTFMVMHPSLSYFARDYGLHQISIGSEGKEYSIGDTRALLDDIKHHNTEVFLVDKDFNTSNAEVLSGNGIRIVTINPLNYEWDNELTQTARAIAGK